MTTKPWILVLPESLAIRLRSHLFPGDQDEHGAVIAAGVTETGGEVRLLARQVFEAGDGIDYVPGQRGYRMLTASFVLGKVMYCRDARLAYLAVHCHGGTDRVGFSRDDLASHERGYPALVDVIRGQPVGGLVFAQNAVAGDIWLPEGNRVDLSEARIVGRRIQRLYPAPPPRPSGSDPTYDRQARVFGDRGQAILSGIKVGIIGAGGAGSLLVEYLSRLGVGHLVVADPDRVEESNIPRLVGSTRWDAKTVLAHTWWPPFIQTLGRKLRSKKVKVAKKVAKAANHRVHIETLDRSIVEDRVARHFVDCDYLFLAADSMQARLVFNAIVHQYLIPGIQVGAKVLPNAKTGDIIDVFSVVRPITPDSGCLWCNGLISSEKLQEEALTEEERRAQRYVDEPEVIAPSVITLNAVATSIAANDFLFSVTGLTDENIAQHYLRVLPRSREFYFDEPRRDGFCLECSAQDTSRFARGDSHPLPTKRG